MAASHYRWNTPEIAADVVDGEAVIIHLTDGTYFSLDPVGTLVWEALGAPQADVAIASALAARFGIPEGEALADTRGLLEALARDGLIVACEPEDRASTVRFTPDAVTRYEPARLTKYTDMADMLALDPPLPGTQNLPWKAPTNG